MKAGVPCVSGKINPDVLASFNSWINDGQEDRYDENGFLKPEYEDEYENEEDEPFQFMGWFENQNVSDEVLALEDSLYD